MNLYLPIVYLPTCTVYLPTFVAVWRRSSRDSSVLSGETVHEPIFTYRIFTYICSCMEEKLP